MKTGRVKPESGLNLREQANGRKTGVLIHNEEVDILEEITWYRVRTRDGRVGYVHGDYLDLSPQVAVLPEATDPAVIALAQPEFELVTYQGGQFTGKEVQVDKDFIPALERINLYASECDIKVWVTSAIRNLNEQVNGAIVTPASRSCHHIGHAIDMNVQYQGRLYNSAALKKANHDQLPAAVTGFIQRLREDAELRWGGDFATEDPVHIDDDFYHLQEAFYLAKLQSRVNQLNA